MADDKEVKYLMHYKQINLQQPLLPHDGNSQNINLNVNNTFKRKESVSNEVLHYIIKHRKKKQPETFKMNSFDSIRQIKPLNINGPNTPVNNNTKLPVLRHASFEKNLETLHSCKNLQKLNFYNNAKWIIYRCQFSTQEESCCCSCNSDAMFEVMKSLYDCYKKKNCDHCNCILCGHLPREERRLGEARKSGELAMASLQARGKRKKVKSKEVMAALEGKTYDEKEAELKKLILSGANLPEGKTQSQRDLIAKVKTQLALPPAPRTKSEKALYKKAEAEGLITPLEGKTKSQKTKILQKQKALGITLPEGRTSSEKALIQKIKSGAAPSISTVPSEKIRKAKKEGLLTPLEEKTLEQKEKILKGLVMNGIPLPKAKTSSERKLINKVRVDMGLPPEPKTASEKSNYKKALAAGLITPLEGKSKSQKENLLKKQAEIGLSLPEGRTNSEKSLIAKIRKSVPHPPSEYKPPTEKLLKAKAAGLLTPLEGKTVKQKEDILRGLAMNGIPFPEAKTDDEQKLMQKVRTDLGLPPEPISSSEKHNYKKALVAGIITPLEGKTQPQKEEILRKQAEMGLSLPTGRTPSEKALITKIKQTSARPPSEYKVPSEKIRKAKAAGLLTPLEGKTPKQKEDILRGLAINGIPLPKGKTDDEQKLIDNVRADLGLPPEPKTSFEKHNYKKALAAGLITPLEGKTQPQKEDILRKQAEMGLSLPIGRTPSEKALIAKVKQTAVRPPSEYKAPSEKIRRAKAAGLLTPLEGKTLKQKEDILRGLAMNGVPLPEAKTDDEKKLIDKVRADLGLPPEPVTSSDKHNYKKALVAGLITPLEGKSQSQKEDILRKQAEIGLSLPEGRTASEKALIAKVRQTTRPMPEKEHLVVPKEREKVLKELAMKGNQLPEAKTASEEKILTKVRRDLGLPPEPKSKVEKEKYLKALSAGVLIPLEGKSKSEKEKILQAQADMGLALPEGRTASEKALINKIKTGKIKRAKSLAEVKKLDEKTAKVMREGKGPSDECICEILTPESEKYISSAKTRIPSEKLRIAKTAGLLTPLEGKSVKEKERIIKGLVKEGLPLPEPKTASEKKLIEKVKTEMGVPMVRISSEKLRRARAAGLLTPLEGKTEKEKERIVKSLAKEGLPLPEPKTASEKKLITRVRKDLGIPLEGIQSEKLRRARATGLITPLEGKTPAQKEKLLKGRVAAGLPLPEGVTLSDKELIKKIRAETGYITPSAIRSKSRVIKIPSEKIKAAKAAGLLTPLHGKTDAQKEKILKGMAAHGIPLPKGKTDSEKKVIDKVRKEVGLPPEPKTLSVKEKYRQAQESGFITPLEGKSPAQKEKILRKQAEIGIPLPEGRTQSEKDLIDKIKFMTKPVASEKFRKAKEAGLLTPLQGKSPKDQEKILKGLAKAGLPLPEGKTESEKQLIKKVKVDMGVPLEGMPSDKLRKAIAEGIITPLEGKSHAQKEKLLKARAHAGLPLPEGISPSEKELIKKVKAETGYISPAKLEKLKRISQAAFPPKGVFSPAQREKMLKDLALQGKLLPEPKSASESKLINKVRHDLGLPQEPKTKAERDKHKKALAAGILVPLEGKSKREKEKILQAEADMGLTLPEGRTASEKSLIKKIKTSKRKRAISPVEVKKLDDKTAKIIKEGKGPSDECICDILTPKSEKVIPSSRHRVPSEKMRKAKEAGLLTPLEGKSMKEKERIIKSLAKEGLPLPEPKTASEKKLIEKVKTEMGVPPMKISSQKLRRAREAGLLTPLEGKSEQEKERILKTLAKEGLPLPEPKTASEKKVFEKVKAEVGLPITTIPADKFRKARMAGLMTPLQGKSEKEKEKILRSLAKERLPLPEPKTASEKRLLEKVKTEVGVPVITIPSEKIRKAKAAGLLTPLEGKSEKDKERILRNMAKEGLPLPEPKTASEKQLIEKLKREISEAVLKIPSEKIRKARAAGLLTPLEGKTEKEKERILKSLAKEGLPLPEPKTASERKVFEKVKAEMGVPISTVPADKFRKARLAGYFTPLEGKSKKEKEKILKSLAKEGLPLPEPKTASEKRLLEKVKTEVGVPVITIPSEKIRKAKAAGLLTPLEGKSEKDKERILRNMAKEGFPLPEPKTASEKQLIEKLKREISEPVLKIPSEKIRKARAAGLLTPLEGKTEKEKKRILKSLAKEGLPLPEPKTASERKVFEKVQAEMDVPISTVPADKFRKARLAGLLTPLEGKSGKEKEKILKSLAKEGLPLPEPKTASEKKLIQKVRTEFGIPLVATPSEKIRKAKEAGLLTPIRGKPDHEKERILKNLAKTGVPLPKAETLSERKIMDKVRKDLGLPPEPKTSSIREKYKKAYDAGIITPLEGKSPMQKEKILTKQAEMGITLPEGRTSSEKQLIDKIRAAVSQKKVIGESDMSLTASKKEIWKKAKTDGLLTPLKGKSPAEKERIIKGLAEAGLPMPEAKSASEKSLIQKVRTSLGLPPEPTPSERKRKIRTKTKRTGAAKAKLSEIGVGKSKVGITEEFQDIIKTTTCDRGCGCDRKKIRFKHSYVKIRVTSPDISSLCPCPDECVPGVRGGVFTDNEGIKVTVGQVTGAASFHSKEFYIPLNVNSCESRLVFSETMLNNVREHQSSFNNSQYDENDNFKTERGHKYELVLNESKSSYTDTYLMIKSSSDFDESKLSVDIPFLLNTFNSSLFSSSSVISNTISIISISVTDCTSNSAYLIEGLNSISTCSLQGDYTQSSFSSKTSESVSCFSIFKNRKFFQEHSGTVVLPTILRVSTGISHVLNTCPPDSNVDHNYSHYKLSKAIGKILSEQSLRDLSSLYLLLPTSSEDLQSLKDSQSSTICIQVTEKCKGYFKGPSLTPKEKPQSGFKFAARGRLADDTNALVFEKSREASVYQTTRVPKRFDICTDTTVDRPCCCEILRQRTTNTQHTKMTTVVSQLVAPFIINGATSQGLSPEKYNVTSQKNNLYSPKKMCPNPTPVRLCKIPPCSNFSDCHTPKNKPTKTSTTKVNDLVSPVDKQCGCDFDKIKEIIEQVGKELLSTACANNNSRTGVAGEIGHRKPIIKKTNFQEASKSLDCISCGYPSSKEEQKKQCPCERTASQMSNIKIEGTADVNISDTNERQDKNKSRRFKYFGKKSKKRNRNNVCECPPTPTEELDPILWVDEKEVRKMKSFLTQNTSGFKINALRRVPEPEMSFEEALSYVILSDEEKYRKLLCLCEEKHGSKKKKAECECPDGQEVTQPRPEEPKGLKLHIGAKGSSSKGLSGVLCFPLLDQE